MKKTTKIRRKPESERAEARLQMRVQDRDKRRWTEIAERREMTLAALVTETMNAMARRVRK